MIKARGGFTLVELMITMVIMVILTALAVVVTGNIQAQARDNERTQDIQALARGLEIRYTKLSTYTISTDPPSTITITAGKYPGDQEMWEWGWYRSIPNNNIFVGASDDAIISPSGERLGYICALAGFNQPTCDKAEKASNIEKAFRNQDDTGWRDIYLYESTTYDKRYCNNDPAWNGTDDCTRFNLYWISETDKTINPAYPNIPGLKILRSKHQQ
jgi:prepilin-type N-terminal cleavage/methylation domain-containing protein